MADKNFKIKTGLSLPQPLPADQGGTGQSSLTNALNAMLPVQTSAANKVLSSDGTNTTWIDPARGIKSGNTASRPSSPATGDLYYNTETSGLEVYDGGWWIPNVRPTAQTSLVATNQGTGRAYNNGQASVSFNPGANSGKVTTYTIYSNPGSFSNTGSSSPIVITGLQSGVSYTFTGYTENSFGASTSDAIASSAITATTIPQAPAVTASAASQSATISITPGSTGGSAITQYSIISSPATTTQTTSSTTYTFTGLTDGTAYTFSVTATNANGVSASSAASNSVTPASTISGVSYLLVAGGGGGGTNWGEASGGGGAGGMRYFTSQTINANTPITVTPGAGGAAGSVGGNSVFGSQSATGGGNGANTNGGSGVAGGSGGGGNTSNGSPGAGNAGGYTPVEGYRGGLGAAIGNNYCAAGGGGSGGVGNNQTTGGSPGGISGGIGTANSITGSSITYAAGGSGGCGGSAGGFAGVGSTTIGGGGGGYGSNGVTRPAGQWGIVIVRFPNTYTPTVSAGLTYSTATTGSDKVYSFTAGTGTITF